MKMLFSSTLLMGTLYIAVSNSLDELEKNSVYKGSIVSYQVCRKDGTVILEKNPDFLMVGASTWKILSGLFILDRLGPDYQSQTKFWVQNQSIWIDSPGDPSITLDKIELIKAKLKIKESLEKVYLKQAYFPGYSQHSELEDLNYYYSAPITAWSIQGGVFKLDWKNDTLTTSPFQEEIQFKKVHSSKENWKYNPFSKKIIFYGSQPKSYSITLPLAKPDHSLGRQFGKKVIKTLKMPHSIPNYILTGEKCIKLLTSAVKDSNDWLTEQLYFMAITKNNLTLNKLSPEDQSKEAAKDFKLFLSTTLSLPITECAFVQGSDGIGRHNRLTVKALNKALLWNQKQSTGNLFKQCMAIPGEEGRLKDRLPKVKGYLKTGQMDKAVALSGYITTPGGEERIASIIVNGSAVSVPELRKYVDEYMILFSQDVICENKIIIYKGKL